MGPAVLLPREHDAVTGPPADLIVRDHFAEHAARPRVGDPDLASRAASGPSPARESAARRATCPRATPTRPGPVSKTLRGRPWGRPPARAPRRCAADSRPRPARPTPPARRPRPGCGGWGTHLS